MESTLSRLAVASQRAPSLRSFQILKRHDELRLRAFFLSFDFDQRRAYFGGGMSDPAIREYCETIDWENTTIIARSGPACIDAVVILASLPPAHTTAKLSFACPLSSNQAQVVHELLDLVIDVAALRFRKLIVGRELANSELLALLRENQTARFNCEHVEIHLDVGSQWKISGWLKPFLTRRRPPQTIRETIVQKFLQRAMPKGDRDELLNWLVGLIVLRKRRHRHPRIDAQRCAPGAGPGVTGSRTSYRGEPERIESVQRIFDQHAAAITHATPAASVC